MTPDQIDIALSELETRVDRLRALYEQYFMGIERLEPHVPRKDVERRFNELRKVPFRNTARRFKFQTLVQRYSTMQQYWQRICREIENGTYKRHKLRAEKAFGPLTDLLRAPRDETERGDAEERERPDPRDLSGESDASDDALRAALAAAEAAVEERAEPGRGLLGQLRGRTNGEGPGAALPLGNLPRPQVALPPPPAVKLPPLPGAPARPVPPGPPPSPPARASEERTDTGVRRAPVEPRVQTEPARPVVAATAAHLDDDRIQKLHREYLDARAKTNATPVSYEKLAQNIRDTERKLREQHGGKNVDFEVVIKDGKAILKPKLR